MNQRYSKKFEKIDDETSRLRVPDGWIIRTIVRNSEGISVHTFFLKDIMTHWDLSKSD